MNLLYNTSIGLYRLAADVASFRSDKVREMVHGQRETLSRLSSVRDKLAPDGFDVWIHAASLGEFEQGRPIIDRLRREQPEKKILLTFFSPSGYRVRKNYPNVDAVAYLPFDTPGMVSEFLDAAKPKMAVFVKYEFWGNYLEQLRARAVPCYIISAIFRSSQVFFKPYGGMFRRMLGNFTRLYVQDEGSKKLLDGIGVTNVVVAGDTRFDRVTDVLRQAKQVPEIARFVDGSRLCVVAGSTWPPDEDILVPWLNGHREYKAVIAPHEFDEQRLCNLENKFGGDAVRLSALQNGVPIPESARVVIVDCFGLLSSLYGYGQIAYVGGGFGTGIHNINEAAVYGVPVVFGPKHHKFKEAADMLALGGAFEIKNVREGNDILDRLAVNEAFRRHAGDVAGRYICEHIGASDIIYNDLFGK